MRINRAEYGDHGLSLIKQLMIIVIMCFMLMMTACAGSSLSEGSASEVASETAAEDQAESKNIESDLQEMNATDMDRNESDSNSNFDSDSGSNPDSVPNTQKISIDQSPGTSIKLQAPTFTYKDIPDYADRPYAEINHNVPFFESVTTENFEAYSDLDQYGRCGACMINACMDTQPKEPRGEIGHVQPSGWQTVKYPDLIEDLYLYNRCHLLAHAISGKNDLETNLITGTRYMNMSGMLPFEEKIISYLSDPQHEDDHVLYRVTPIFRKKELVARGVLMEAYSVEDEGEGICFNVFCYNVQPGIEINYATGESQIADSYVKVPVAEGVELETKEVLSQNGVGEDKVIPATVTYIGNASSKKLHLPGCGSVKDMATHNMVELTCSRQEAIDMGYVPCKNCNP